MSQLEDTLYGVPGPAVDICSAQFVDLHHSSSLSLVVSESDGRFCHLGVVDRNARRFAIYGFDLAHGADFPEIQDLDRNGNLELIVPTDLTGYYGAQYCEAEWPIIYAWTGSGYAEVSDHYKNYYRQQLASLKKEIADAEAQKVRAETEAMLHRTGPDAASVQVGPQFRFDSPASGSGRESLVAPPAGGVGPSARLTYRPLVEPAPRQPPAPPPPDSQGLNCTKAEAAKIERFLGLSRDAGMGDVSTWANSDIPYEREFAADILADIGTPDAAGYLRTLSRDTNRAVASTAKLHLQQLSKGPVVHAVDREEIPN